MTSLTGTRRQRVHEATTSEIKDVARRLMAAEGTSSLNLRAVAREMGMTPSALYRYFASRDAILDALIADAYDAVGEAVEEAAAHAVAHPELGPAAPMLAAVHAFRRWALEHPQEYALIYGTPVPGYHAPDSTLGPSMRTNMVLLGLLQQSLDAGLVRPPDARLLSPQVHALLTRLGDSQEKAHFGLPPEVWAIAMQFWVVLYGAINAEVFGHLPDVIVGGAAEFFDFTMRRALVVIGADAEGIAASRSPQH